MSWFDPSEFFPKLRRTVAAIAKVANQQPGIQSVFRLLRIERRLGRKTLMMRGKFHLTDPRPAEPHQPGHYLLHGFKKRRMPN